jgi:type I restriction enzyme S subunit
VFEGAGNILKTSDIILFPLAELGDWVGGGTPSKSNPSYWENGTIPWVSPKDMKTTHIRAAEDNITEQAAKESATNLVPAGSILVVTRSGILRHTFPVAVADVHVTINQDLKALVLKPEIDPKYVAFALRAFSRDILNQCSKQGTTVNSIETQKLLRFQIPLTSYPQQTRIVAEIEKQFSRLDEAVANLKRVKANLKRYKAAVLKAAVEGKLTEEWRRGAIHRAHQSDEQGAMNQGAINRAPTETGAELLQRILAERRKAAGKGKYKEPVGPDTSGLPELPEGWVWASVEQLGAVKGGKRLPAGHSYAEGPTPFPYIRVTDFKDLGIRTSELLYLSKETQREISRYTISEDDVYISIAGTIGLVGQVPSQLSGANLTENAAKITDFYHTNQKYLIYWLSSPDGIVHIAQSTIATTQAKLALFRIEQIPVPLPPLADTAKNRTKDKKRAQSIAPLRETEPKPAEPDDFASLDAVLTTILNRMQPGREYSRAELADPLGLSTGRWNAAIQELRRRGKVRQVGEGAAGGGRCGRWGKVRQVGERRGARYERV